MLRLRTTRNDSLGRGLLVVLLVTMFTTGPTWAQAAIATDQLKPLATTQPDGPSTSLVTAITPDGQVGNFEELPWSDESPLEWQDPENPDMSFIATADLVQATPNAQVWHGEAIDAITGDVVVSLKATISYSDAGALWHVSFERFENRFGFDPIPLSTSIELFEPGEDGDNEIAVPGDITWLLIVLAANALALVLTNGGWVPNGCNKPCSQKWILCCIPHDACYCVGGNENNRKFCDIAFALCLAAAGMPPKSVKAYYNGVRLFGGLFFNYR